MDDVNFPRSRVIDLQLFEPINHALEVGDCRQSDAGCNDSWRVPGNYHRRLARRKRQLGGGRAHDDWTAIEPFLVAGGLGASPEVEELRSC